ncbi:MAG: hypothetical protein ABJA02_01980 [Acidobacteriota bacterium]
MALLDIAVIYFSCGSPFAVHALMTNADGRPLITALRAAFNIAAWPVLAAGLLYRIAASKVSIELPDYETDGDSKLKTILSDLEKLSHTELGAGSFFAFRDAIARYTALAAAFSDTDGPLSTAEIFEIAEHPDPVMGSICLSRGTRQRLLLHLNQARSKFVDFVSDLSIRSDDADRIGRLSMAVAESVNDSEGVRQLTTIFDTADGSAIRKVPSLDGEQIWITEQVSPIVS